MKKLEFPVAVVIWVSAWFELFDSLQEGLDLPSIVVMGVSYFTTFLLIRVASGRDAEVQLLLFPSMCMIAASGVLRLFLQGEGISLLVIIPQVIILWRVWRWYSHEYNNPVEWSDT